MEVLRAAEKCLEIFDWLASALSCGLSLLFGAVGVVFGLLSFAEQGTLGGQEWTLGIAVLWLVLSGLFALAAVGMRLKTRWRWYLQASPLLAYFVGFTLVLCATGTTVFWFDGVKLCG